MYGKEIKAAFKLSGSEKNVSKTQQSMKGASQKSSTAKELEQYCPEESMLPQLLVLSRFFFAGVHLVPEIDGIF